MGFVNDKMGETLHSEGYDNKGNYRQNMFNQNGTP